MTECCVCSDELTMKTIVNLECGHRFCKDCIWRWTKDKNTCPCCRGNILGNTKGTTRDATHAGAYHASLSNCATGGRRI